MSDNILIGLAPMIIWQWCLNSNIQHSILVHYNYRLEYCLKGFKSEYYLSKYEPRTKVLENLLLYICMHRNVAYSKINSRIKLAVHKIFPDFWGFDTPVLTFSQYIVSRNLGGWHRWKIHNSHRTYQSQSITPLVRSKT